MNRRALLLGLAAAPFAPKVAEALPEPSPEPAFDAVAESESVWLPVPGTPRYWRFYVSQGRGDAAPTITLQGSADLSSWAPV